MLLKDKVIIVTGVGPGMGQKLALIGAAEGARVAVSARSKGFIEEIAQQIEAKGGEAIAVPTDVADQGQCDRLAARAIEAFGRIDGLINSAYAHDPFGPFEETDLAGWEKNFSVTFFGALRMAKSVLPQMKKQKGGAIVNVSSMTTVQPYHGEGAYGSAKSAMNGATRFLAAELGKYNIRVNVTRMGRLWGVPVQNALGQIAKAQNVPVQSLIDAWGKLNPFGIIPPDEECAKSVLFFVSDYSKMVTGASLDINGGEYMAP